MDIVAKFKQLQVVSKIVQELENHLGLSDKDLAEFIINLADKNELQDFVKDLNENGGDEFPEQFVINL
jgi:ATP-dependent RNA helicase DHX8/PRP22